MRNIIYTIILALTLVTTDASAQHRGIPALCIHLKDGTRDTLYKHNNMRMYGLENASAGEYIRAYFTNQNSPNMVWYNYSDYAMEGYEDMGFIISDLLLSDDVEIPDRSCSYDKGNNFTFSSFFTYLNGEWVVPEGTLYNSSRRYEFNPRDNNFFELGKTYYCYGFYKEDGKTYLYYDEMQGTARLPKPMQGVIDREKIDVSFSTDSYAVMVSTTDEAKQKFKERYGTESPYIEYALKEIKKAYATSLTEDQLQQLAYSTETCDDGKIYFISLTESCVERLLNETDAKGKETVYAQANLSSVLDRSDKRNSSFHFCTFGATVEMRECDASWGIKDNKYLTTVPTSVSARPQVSLRVNRVMLPNVTYNITFSIAPQTDSTQPNDKPLYFRAYFAEGANEMLIDEKFPRADEKNYLLNSAVTEGTIREKSLFEASSSEVTTFTVQYTPETFAYSHGFMIQNAKSFVTSSNRNKYEQNIRLIGVEVTPAN